jgi:iron complex transport system substrate-binding protein
MDKRTKKATTLLVALVLLAALVLGLAGCDSQAAGQTTSTAAAQTTTSAAAQSATTAPQAATDGETRTIVDMLGRTVTLKKDIARVVTVEGCCPLPGLMSMLGCSDKLVSGLCYDFPLQLAVSPEYKALAGSMVAQQDNKVNYEELLAQKADVIFLYKIDNADELASLGLPVVCVSYSSWDDVKKLVTLLGEIFGKQDQAATYLTYADNLLQELDTKLKDIPEDKKVTAMMSTSINPLTVKGLKSHNQSMFERSGAISIATTLNLDGYSVEASMEDLIKASADYYILSGFLDKEYQDMQTNADWQKLNAIRSGNLYITPIGAFVWDRPGAELPLLAVWQANIFYPDLVSDQYLHDKVVDFYKTCFRYDLTEADYADLMKYDHE